MAGYGYVEPKFGGIRPPKRSLASAAGGDPFGLSGADAFRMLNPQPLSPAAGYQLLNPPAPAKTSAPSAPAAPSGAAVAAAAQGSKQPQAPTLPQFDLSTDPALQQVQAFTGMSDEQARAAALKDREDLLLQYGDPNLIKSVLGEDSLAQAASQSPTSQLAQLKNQYTQGEQDLTNSLVPQNLLYSGYRVKQENQLGQNYQNALAQAAAGVQGSLDQITQNLNGALAQNEQQRSSALGDAYNRELQLALAGGLAPTGDSGSGSSAPPPSEYTSLPGPLASTEEPGSFGPGSGLAGQPSLISLLKAAASKPRGGRSIAF